MEGIWKPGIQEKGRRQKSFATSWLPGFQIRFSVLLHATQIGPQPIARVPRISGSETPPAARSTLVARLDAAKQIASDNARDDALRFVALDAAKANDPQTAMAAVQGIGSVDVNEKTTEEIALLFAKAGMPAQAREMAQRIGSTEVRDRTLSAIAKGEPAPTPPQPPPSPALR